MLITLGIIGIIAAMTLPSLIQTNKNKEVEVKLKKVYSVMNQAILLSENDNGPKEYWEYSANNGKAFLTKYILPYLRYLGMRDFVSFGGQNVAIYFADGSVLVNKGCTDFFFFPNAKNFDALTFTNQDESGNWLAEREGCGITYFAFAFGAVDSTETSSNRYHWHKGFEPYKYYLSDFTKEALTKSGNSYACNATAKNKVYCTALVQLNGWTIPKDYPFKVK